MKSHTAAYQAREDTTPLSTVLVLPTTLPKASPVLMHPSSLALALALSLTEWHLAGPTPPCDTYDIISRATDSDKVPTS